MRTQISVYNLDITEMSDVEILKALTKIVIAESEKCVYENYDEEPQDGPFFYDRKHLGFLEHLIDEVSKILMRSVTYKPHLKLISEIRTDLYMGRNDFHEPKLIKDVINDVAWDYFKKDEKVLDRNASNPQYHYSYIVRKLRPMSNKLAKIIAENEIGDVFNHRGW